LIGLFDSFVIGEFEVSNGENQTVGLSILKKIFKEILK